jgi:hypothetical protein
MYVLYRGDEDVFSRGLQRIHNMTETVYYILYTHVGEVCSAPTTCPPPLRVQSITGAPKKFHFYTYFIANIFRFINYQIPENPLQI